MVDYKIPTMDIVWIVGLICLLVVFLALCWRYWYMTRRIDDEVEGGVENSPVYIPEVHQWYADTGMEKDDWGEGRTTVGYPVQRVTKDRQGEDKEEEEEKEEKEEERFSPEMQQRLDAMAAMRQLLAKFGPNRQLNPPTALERHARSRTPHAGI
jgi:hypothetical protein